MQESKRSRVFILPILLVLFTMLVSACGSAGNNSGSTAMAPPDKQVLRWPDVAIDDFGTLDPALGQDGADIFPMNTIYTSLVQLDDNNTVKDQLAASHTVSSDGMTYSFTLRPGLKFSDGSPLTANDVAYSINRAIDPATKSPVSYYLNLIKDYDKFQAGKLKTVIGDSLIVKDDTHIDIVISKPAAYFLQAMTYSTSRVVNKKLIDKYGASWTDHLGEGAGDGPFKVSSYNHNKGLELVPNTNYYGPQPKLQKLEILFSGDIDTSYKAYLSDQYDVATSVPAASLADALQRKDVHSYPALTIYYLSMNYMAKPWDDIKVRQAFAVALNRDLLVQSVLKGTGYATNHIDPEGQPGYYKDLKSADGTTGTKGNPDLAKQLLQQSSYGSASKLPPITLTYVSGSTARNSLVTAMIQQWKDVLGVDVKLATAERSKMTQLGSATVGSSGPLSLWFDGWGADYPDPQDWLSTFFDKGSGYNSANYGQNNSPNAAQQVAVQKQLQQADVTLDPTKRMQLYADAEQKLINDVAWAPVYQAKT
ncbi:MAG: peptide ABC transporter substrate-binding protein, partial [Ktedonobacteraceae bacterium]|nr:peptide ABC transporter substrate-binding protein [Ktedonobacteraceae bacterium]